MLTSILCVTTLAANDLSHTLRHPLYQAWTHVADVLIMMPDLQYAFDQGTLSGGFHCIDLAFQEMPKVLYRIHIRVNFRASLTKQSSPV